MLEVTPDALLFSWRVLRRNDAPRHVAMRLIRGAGTRLELLPDAMRPDDHSFDVKGRVVLVVDQALGAALNGRRLFVKNSGQGEGQLRLEKVV